MAQLESCTARADICAFAGTSHTHCGCGLPIPARAGYCAMCIRELARGAVMSTYDPNAPRERALLQGRPQSNHRARKLLPLGHVNWQTTPTCRHGHVMTADNTLYMTDRKTQRRYRYCRDCRGFSKRRQRAREKAA